MPKDHETVTGTESRQGFLDRPVLLVLLGGLVLVILGFGLLMLWPAKKATAEPLTAISEVTLDAPFAQVFARP